MSDASPVFSSNAVRLSWRDWRITLGLVCVAMLTLPPLCRKWEKVEPPPSFRMPYGLMEDYWLYSRWAEHAARRYPVVVIGDSFIWGEYADASDTLPQCLNRAVGKDCFTNLGLNGLHPAAAEGLVRYYGRRIADKGALVHFNPLWVQSPQLDRGGDADSEKFLLQHPRLIPQFSVRPQAYRAELTERLGIALSRELPFLGLRNHLQIAYFDKLSPMEWAMKNPYRNPFASRTALAPSIRKSARAHSEPQPWTEKGIPPQDYPWLKLEDSFQWASFEREIEVLRSRKNTVFVLLGPFNPHLLTPASLGRYNALRAQMERALAAANVPFYLVPDLPSALYTDASHVARDGYAEIARLVLQDESFRAWTSAVTSRK
ncbi:MAG: hypothetical protein FJ279_14910 [Planctomycetes bacterium]|nr:hypothetical protein [Planctomycetota bacterium]MBM4078254.1 hypothetical protein [Planctomycetota bacterium]MBM4083891.1 hypothetical protein [Planctomycetota bacterium]